MKQKLGFGLEEARAVLDACRKDHTWRGRRDALLLALLFCRGLRISEILCIDLGWVLNPDGTVKDEFVIPKEYTKAKRLDCLVKMGPGLRALVAAVVADGPQGDRSLPLFRGFHGGRLDRKGGFRIIKARTAAAGFDPRQRAPHSARRTMGRAMNTQEAADAFFQETGISIRPLRLAQRALRHAHSNITEGYLDDTSEDNAGEFADRYMESRMGLDG